MKYARRYGKEKKCDHAAAPVVVKPEPPEPKWVWLRFVNERPNNWNTSDLVVAASCPCRDTNGTLAQLGTRKFFDYVEIFIDDEWHEVEVQPSPQEYILSVTTTVRVRANSAEQALEKAHKSYGSQSLIVIDEIVNLDTRDVKP